MEPIDRLPREKVRALFTDLDDTLTEHGRISAATYAALERLGERGLKTVIVSGRPAGWADALMRLWPLDAMVFENGAGVLVRGEQKTEVVNLAGDASREAQSRRLAEIFAEVRREVPHAKLASDQPYRLFDYAIDFTEDPPRLSPDELEKVLAVLGRHGDITFKLSSIHVNYWYGTHTKVTACRHLLRHLGLSPEEVVYVGDSPNDEPLFGFFPLSTGVANVRQFVDRMHSLPRYVTKRPNGSGFQELVAHLLST